jgi:hypothetical protein
MGAISSPSPTLLLVAAFSRRDEALDWARQKIAEHWAPIALESPRFEFVETTYYDATMGPGLKKCFWLSAEPFDPGRLAGLKLAANAWEAEYAALGAWTEPRPLNIDPGYLTLAKLVLASTKDHAHRIYLSQGIFAEVTLSFRDGRWQPLPWTFPDYRRADYQAFFTECRERLKRAQGGAAARRRESPDAAGSESGADE